MKRGAERELNKDNADEEELEETPTEGFRKADESVLATRVIRGLPKRAHATPITAATQQSVLTNEKDKSTQNFGAFSNKTFSFASPANGTSAPGPTSQSAFNPVFSNPVVSSSASITAKKLASFLNPSSSPTELPAPRQPPTEAPNVDDPALYKYYTSLRGLNISLLDALIQTTEKDPFADISDLLDRYKNFRLDVQKEFNKQSLVPEPTVPQKQASMPTPPAKSFTFRPSITASSENAGQSQPHHTSSSATTLSPFTFTSSTTPSTTSPFSTATKSAFSFKPTPDDGDSSRSGESKSSEFSGHNFGTPSGPSFTFGGPSTTKLEVKDTSSKPFTFAPMTDTNKSLSGTETKGISVSPASSGQSASAFSIGAHSTPNPFGSNSQSLFATAPTSSQTNSGTFGGFGGFGNSSGAGGSIGNPVGFSFGSPARTPDSEPATGEGTLSPHEADTHGGGNTAAIDSREGQDAANNEPPSALLTKNPHDEEGEGEENEDTVHAVKVKAFVLRKSKENMAPGWAELGQGFLRLKKHKESETRRILLRNSNTGKINLNFYLYSGFKSTQNKKSLTFVGHDESKTSQTYSVRLQDEQQASALKEALDQEIAAVNAKSTD